MQITALGVQYRRAPLAVREALAFGPAQTEAVLKRLTQACPGAEGVLVATCNRTELYAAFPTGTHAPDLRTLLAHEAQLSPATLDEVTFALHEEDALRHLFGVCTGLDSMVLGEPQVLGQVRQAYQSASGGGFVGAALHIVFQQALSTAKQARTSTGIDRGRTSIGSVAANVAATVFRTLTDKTVLAVGAGEMGKAALAHLAELKPGRVLIANRSPVRAQELAAKLAPKLATPAGIHGLDEVDALLAQADVVVFSTSAPHPMLTAAKAKAALKARHGRPLLILDLAVPRDVEAGVAQLDNVYLYNVDDLQSAISTTEAERRDKTEACHTFIDRGVATAMAQVKNRSNGDLMRRLRDQFEETIRIEEDRLIKRLAALPQTGGQLDEAQMRAALADHHHHLVNKFLRGPAKRLNPKHHGADAEAETGLPKDMLGLAVEELFGLEGKEEKGSPA